MVSAIRPSADCRGRCCALSAAQAQPSSRERRQAVSTTWKPIQVGRITYKGSVPDTDPRYKSGWNYLSGKNLNPHSAKPSKEQAKPEQEAAAAQRNYFSSGH